MMWHKQYRQTNKPHHDYWYQDTEENLMKEYIARHWNQSVLEILEGYKKDAVYGCSDPRMHLTEREQVLKLTNASAERHREDFMEPLTTM